MYDELIRQMMACCKGVPCEDANCGFNPKSDLDCIEQLLTRAADAIEELSHIQIAPEKIIQTMWIPVTERLPQKADTYLVFVANVFQKSMAATTTALWGGQNFIVGDFVTVTHWMPLPQPPEDSET